MARKNSLLTRNQTSVFTRNQKSAIRKIAKQASSNGCETKCHFTHSDESGLNSLSQGIFWDPMNLAQGTGGGERVGKQVRAQRLTIRGVLHNNSNSATQFVRMIVFWAKDRSSFSSASGELFLNAIGGTGIPSDVSAITGLDAIYMPTNPSLVTVLHDEVFRLGSASGTGRDSQFYGVDLRLGNKLIQFEEGTAGGSENVFPRLHVFFVTSEAPDDTGIGQVVENSCVMRFYYHDS
jgi:hypothetical protein